MKPPRWACCRALLAGVSVVLGVAFAAWAQPAAAADPAIPLLDRAEFIATDDAEPFARTGMRCSRLSPTSLDGRDDLFAECVGSCR